MAHESQEHVECSHRDFLQMRQTIENIELCIAVVLKERNQIGVWRSIVMLECLTVTRALV